MSTNITPSSIPGRSNVMPHDFLRHIGATARTVSELMKDGKPAKAVIATRTYDTNPADLWDAITSAQRIPRWFLPVEGDLKLGGRYQFKGNAGGEITRCEAPRHLAVTWEFGNELTWLDVVLTEVGAEQTQLELTHVAHIDQSRWDEYGPGAVGVGWDGGLMGLAEHISGKPALVPEEAMAWMTSDVGKAFYRASSEAWRLASIASGTPEEAANAAAKRTSLAYTGEG